MKGAVLSGKFVYARRPPRVRDCLAIAPAHRECVAVLCYSAVRRLGRAHPTSKAFPSRLHNCSSNTSTATATATATFSHFLAVIVVVVSDHCGEFVQRYRSH
jgi:hypothetical protein